MQTEKLIGGVIPKAPKKTAQQIRQQKEQIEQIKRDLEIIRKFPAELTARTTAFAQKCRANRQRIKNLFSSKFNSLQALSTHANQMMHESNDEIKLLKQSIATKEKKISTEQKWIKFSKKLLHLQQEEEDLEASLKTQALINLQQLKSLLDIFIDTLEDKRQRMEKVQQFLKQYKKLSVQIKKPRPIVKHAQQVNFKNLPEIEFVPESEEIIFRILTFEGKIIEFILFFDDQVKKFGLKNPCKAFNSMDLNAVRVFNIHKNLSDFHTELSVLVVQYVDDVDDLPVYQGK